MNAVQSKTKTDRPSDGYDQFSNNLRANFAASIKAHGAHVFTTDAADLFETFISGLPEDARQHYTCNCCKKFIRTYGGLVSISAKGKASSVLWDAKGMPEFFKPAAKELARIVADANVTGVFFSADEVWGTKEAGGWKHMHVVPPAELCSLTASQAMNEKGQEYESLHRGLTEYSMATVDQAVVLLQAGKLYRSDRVVGVAEWFQKLHKTLAATKTAKTKTNLIWRAVASAPPGFAYVRSTMIGTLLDDLQAGMAFDDLAARFFAKMDPEQYQRSQVAPTAGAVDQAERVIEKLGLEKSLDRRYMAIEEISDFLWQRRDVAPKTKADGVFAGVATKQKAVAQPGMTLPGSTMTWDKFQRTVLPTATKIEIKAEHKDRFAALVTAVHPESENILQWRNPVSWYYHSGVDSVIKQRVESAGGKHQGNEIRFSLIWDNHTDLDLHCVGPGGHIYWRAKEDRCGGWLDVDANGGVATTMTPVENIRWEVAPVGRYRVYIHNYHERANGRNQYKAELEIAGKVYTFEGVIGRTDSIQELATFHYQKGVAPAIGGHTAVASGTAWSLELNQWHEVAGIVKSPNLWGDSPVPHSGDHTFFLVSGCKDTDQGKGRGFFNEMLRADLRPHRQTLEAFTAATPIAEAVGAAACGLGFSKDAPWNVTLRVTTGGLVAEYKIDRFD